MIYENTCGIFSIRIWEPGMFITLEIGGEEVERIGLEDLHNLKFLTERAIVRLEEYKNK